MVGVILKERATPFLLRLLATHARAGPRNHGKKPFFGGIALFARYDAKMLYLVIGYIFCAVHWGICKEFAKMLYIAFCKVRTDVPLYKQKYPI